MYEPICSFCGSILDEQSQFRGDYLLCQFCTEWKETELDMQVRAICSDVLIIEFFPRNFTLISLN